jgi:hypothetical protein
MFLLPNSESLFSTTHLVLPAGRFRSRPARGVSAHARPGCFARHRRIVWNGLWARVWSRTTANPAIPARFCGRRA